MAKENTENMKNNKILILLSMVFILSLIVLIISVKNSLSIAESKVPKAEADIPDYTGESILYLIRPFGKSVYNDLGIVDFKGMKVNLVTLRTKILFFEDTERVYSDPESLLPYKLERTFSKLWIKLFITEEFDQKKFTITRKWFKGTKLVKEEIIKAKGPIQNPVMLPFSLRRFAAPKIGWNFTAELPDKFKFELVSIDEITVPAGKFQAYHFKSIPDKIEIWINKNNPRVPLKVVGKGIFGCDLSMKQYSLHNNKK